ncbi:hypothetical protein BJF96_g621 [Verticillium dahliae]|nr:hypothetical protein BJF96_g621 [Verticillium dahliae]PNH49167.1 hypothetical protein VD0003_g7964 [Verticillium dahliae]
MSGSHLGLSRHGWLRRFFSNPRDKTGIMDTSDAYRQALERSTTLDTPTEWADESHDVPVARGINRAGCEQWLRDMCFPADDATWNRIKMKWISFLSATSMMPDVALAPNRKAVQFTSGDGRLVDSIEKRFSTDRFHRKVVQASFWADSGLEGLEALAERWPGIAWTALNAADEGRRGQEFQTLAAIWDLGRRRRYQAVLTSMLGFLLYCHEDGALHDLGLQLDQDQQDDLIDLEQGVSVSMMEQRTLRWNKPSALDGVWAVTEQLLVKAMNRRGSTAQNNPLLWWVAIMTKSALEGGTDFISSGRFNMNPMPMDLDLRGRAEALVHYGKILMLNTAFISWNPDRDSFAEVEGDLNLVDNEWLNVEVSHHLDVSPILKVRNIMYSYTHKLSRKQPCTRRG